MSLKDCVSELENLASNYNIDLTQEIYLFLQERYSLINKLLQKHNVNTIEDLLTIQSNLSKELEQFHSMDKNIESLRNECDKTFENASKTAKKIE